MLKMTIDNEEVLSNNDISIKEEILSPSSTILNNVYPKSWELDKDYTSRFYYPKDYSKLNIQNFNIEPEEAGKTIQINGSATLTDVDTSKESRVLRLLGQTSRTGTPTPSSPIPINVVSGDNYIDICGKNRLQPYVYSSPLVKNGITCSYDETTQTYTFNGTCTTDNTIFQIGNNSINMVANQTTCFAYWVNGSANGYCTFRIYDSNFGYSNNFSIDTLTSTNKVVSQTTSYSYVSVPIATSLRFNNGSVANNFKVKFMVANSTDTTYEPYIGHSYPLYLGVENLVNFADRTISSQVAIENINTKYINGEVTLTLNFVNNNSINGVIRLREYGSSTNLKSLVLEANQSGSRSISLDVTPYDAISIIFQGVSSGYNYSVSNVQLTKGNNHISSTPIELCKIGNYQDYIYKDNGSWYLHKEIGKVVLNGSENITTTTYSAGAYFHNIINIGLNGTNNDYAMSNYYTYSSSYMNNTCKTANGGKKLVTRDNFDQSTYITWLGTNKPIFYYLLATPTTTEITDTLLLSQLNDLES